VGISEEIAWHEGLKGKINLPQADRFPDKEVNQSGGGDPIFGMLSVLRIIDKAIVLQ